MNCSMLRDIISAFATCNIFWAKDFKNWRTAAEVVYPNSIDKISGFGAFYTYGTVAHTGYDSWQVQ